MYMYLIIQCVKASVIPCPNQPPTRGDNTVLVTQGGTATPGATKQLLPLDSVCTPDQLRAETTLDIHLHFLFYIYVYICI